MKFFLVTGSSGFVGSHAVTYLRAQQQTVIGVDMVPGPTTDLEVNIGHLSSTEFGNYSEYECIVINCAAYKNDSALDKSVYWIRNVSETELFVDFISKFLTVRKFVHIGSIAEIKGRSIQEREIDELSADDCYRLTKYLQARLIFEACSTYHWQFVNLMPSAIYKDFLGVNNVDKLIQLANITPIFPKIVVKKSMTNLQCLIGELYRSSVSVDKNWVVKIVIDSPILEVHELIKEKCPRCKQIFIPGLYIALIALAFLLKVLRIRSHLTVDRVKKLFEPTDCSIVDLGEDGEFSDKKGKIIERFYMGRVERG